MAKIQHKDIPDAQRHEPKGVSVASQYQVYVANGAGSGTWKKVDARDIQGVGGDSGVSGKILLSDGANGFSSKVFTSYGAMGVTNNTNNFVISAAAADATLHTNSDFVLFSGAGAPFVGDNLYDVSFSVDKLTVSTPGVYEVRFWGNIGEFPTTTAKVGAKFKINGSAWTPRPVVAKASAAGDSMHLSSFEYITLNTNDYVQLFVASSAVGNLVIHDANLTLELKRAT